MPTDRSTLAVYGKAGEVKGSYDLVRALAQLRARGRQFNFAVIGGGEERRQLLAAIEAAGLLPSTWTIPFVPPWRIPQLLRQVTAVCCLERNFPIDIHQPGVAREVLAAGTCLVASGEIAGKQLFRDRLRPGTNALVVDDPRDVDQLAAVLDVVVNDRARAREIGAAGRAVPRTVSEDDLARSYAAVFAWAGRQVAGGPPSPNPTSHMDLRAAMPGTIALLGDRLAPALAAVGDRDSTFERADGLCTWLEQHSGSLDPATIAVATFERNLVWTRTDLETETASLRFPLRDARSMRLTHPPSLANCYPVTSCWLRCERYRPDIAQVIAHALAGRPVPAEPGAPVPFLFVKRGDLSGNVLRVNDSILSMLALCDGSRSATDVLAACPTPAGPALKRLVDEGVIRL